MKKRFVYKTHGVCPPEIHFTINSHILERVRFVGGGCPGNAQLVSKLLEGRSIDDVAALTAGIDCRNATSCPDQLATAIKYATQGELAPVRSFRLHHDTVSRKNIALMGSLEGDADLLKHLLDHVHSQSMDAVYTVGNLTGFGADNAELLKILKKQPVIPVLGQRDWRFAHGEPDAPNDLPMPYKDWLLQQPQVLTFDSPAGKGMAFYGAYLQEMPGYSDYEPFALEINMVCGLTNFMREPEVLPALKAMLPQFQASIVIFGQTGDWGHWQVDNTHFISVGKASEGGLVSWAQLNMDKSGVSFNLMNAGL